MIATDVLNSPYLPPVIGFGLALVTVATSVAVARRDNKVTRTLLGLWIGSVILLFALCVVQAVQNARARIQSGEVSATLKSIEAKCGDMTVAQQLLEARHQINIDATANDAQKWAARVMENLPTMKDEARAVRKADDQVAAQYRMRWHPLFDYVVTMFQQRIEALRAAGMQVRCTSNPWEVVLSGLKGIRIAHPEICYVGEVGTLQLTIRGATLREAKIDQDANLLVYASIRDHVEPVFQLLVKDPNKAALMNTNPQLYGRFSDYEVETDKPREDVGLQLAITEAMNHAFKTAVNESARGEIYRSDKTKDDAQ